MSMHSLRMRRAGGLLASWGLFAATCCAPAAEYNLVRTNAVDRWITNQIEVRVPVNYFVNQYHTNWIPVYRTNYMAFYRTNHLSLFRTNYVALYKTNVFDVYRTNLYTRHLTNTIPVQAFQTNLFTAYRTNWKALSLTNWETVLLFKTNWVSQPVTNVVQVDLQQTQPSSVSAAPAESRAAIVAEHQAPSPAPSAAEPLQIEALRVGAVVNSRVQVKLRLRSTLANAGPVQVQQWRVESQNGSILSFGQEQEFKRELPIGHYKVEVKFKRTGAQTILTTRGSLAVTPTDAFIQHPPLAKN